MRSLRVRLLALFLLVTVVAVGGTAWLTWYEATRQVSRTLRAGQQQITEISGALTRYGQVHGTWYGVSGTVRRLSADTGQRIRLVDESGTVLADSDLLTGHPARPTVGAPGLIDARPTLPSTMRIDGRGAARTIAAKRIGGYETGYRYAACLTRADIPVTRVERPGGPGDILALPTFRPSGTRGDGGCSDQDITSAEIARHTHRLFSCDPSGTRVDAAVDRRYDACLRQRFTELTGEFAPAPLRLSIGARDQATAGLSVGPILGAAGAVALLVLVVALALSRRMLRPIRDLTVAAGRLSDGVDTERVPVLGRDELGQLARSFNRMADSLAEAAERQRRQTADVAHELRTPLANLRGYLEALTDGVIAPSPELFESLHEETLLQQRLVDDLHDLALAEAGALTYHPTPTDLAELVETCRLSHAASAAAAGVDLVVAATGPAVARVDPDRLRQVVGNLITNALRATPAGGRITLGVERAGGRIRVRVADTGGGIGAADLPHVFDRFWRADPARTRGGSGLGLAVARQIVTDHDGTIDAASEPGRGATFTVELPADQLV